MFKIRDNQLDRYFWDWHEFKSIKEMVEALADYHDIDFDHDESLQEYLDWLFKDDDQAKLDRLCDYWMWSIEQV